MAWDDALVDNIDLMKPNKNVTLVHIINKAPMSFQSRDFLDKRICFKHNGSYYMYISFAPDTVYFL
jgi:hypothetical protein